MRMEVVDEGSLGTYFHGGLYSHLFVVRDFALRRAHA
jgi:hypothetical protein